jgi:DNA-binding PadR family transcriptional regulator
MSLKYALLGFLNHYPMTGYELKKFFDTTVAHFWNAEQSQIYSTLKQLEAEDLVEMQVEVQTDRPNRKVYSITEDGRNELREWLAKPADPEQVREPLLIKIFFGRVISREELIQLLQTRIAELERTIDAYEAGRGMMDRFAAAASREDDAEFWKLTVEAGVRHHSSEREWAREAIRRIERLPESVFRATYDPSEKELDPRGAQQLLEAFTAENPNIQVSTLAGGRRANGTQE